MKFQETLFKLCKIDFQICKMLCRCIGCWLDTNGCQTLQVWYYNGLYYPFSLGIISISFLLDKADFDKVRLEIFYCCLWWTERKIQNLFWSVLFKFFKLRNLSLQIVHFFFSNIISKRKELMKNLEKQLSLVRKIGYFK